MQNELSLVRNVLSAAKKWMTGNYLWILICTFTQSNGLLDAVSTLQVGKPSTASLKIANF